MSIGFSSEPDFPHPSCYTIGKVFSFKRYLKHTRKKEKFGAKTIYAVSQNARQKNPKWLYIVRSSKGVLKLECKIEATERGWATARELASGRSQYAHVSLHDPERKYSSKLPPHVEPKEPLVISKNLHRLKMIKDKRKPARITKKFLKQMYPSAFIG